MFGLPISVPPQQVVTDAWSDPRGELTRALGFPAREVLGRLESLQVKIANWVSAVEAVGVKPSIEHGDCHAGNAICREDGSILIFGWENACVSHPFQSAEKLLTSAWALDAGTSGGPWGSRPLKNASLIATWPFSGSLISFSIRHSMLRCA